MIGGILIPEDIFDKIDKATFFIVFIVAVLPYFKKIESFSYWMLAMGIWVAGIIPALLLGGLVQIIINRN